MHTYISALTITAANLLSFAMQSQSGPQASNGDTSVAPQRANLFQNAAGFEIVGGQFVLGDLHNHVGPPSPMRLLASSAPGNRPRTADCISESNNYCSQLLRRGRGFPLYVPGPPGNLPEEYRRNGVSIGDVGTVTPAGVFDFLFNIYLPSDHPINAHVPENFSPLPRYAPDDIVPLDFDPGNYVCTPSVRELGSDSDLPIGRFPGGDFCFRCWGPKGAVLSLPHGSNVNELRNLEGVRRYVACHADSWYKFVNGPRGRGLENGSLYLITGWEKCPSWGMASFQAIPDEEQFQLSFRPSAGEDAGYKYRWQRGNACGKQADASTVSGSPINQTVFVHGFTISLSNSIWGRLFGDVEICQLADPQSPKQTGQFVPYGSQQSFFSWAIGSFGGGGGKHGAARYHNGVTISGFPPTSTIFHPSRLFNDYLLRQAPEATVAITHDDDWLDIFRDHV
ncbi:hypothetical protein C8J57DRAFT_711882 [Mycena rebaudengoi]|nr:hypothetical protein C8J57DRAFT_711882 [Mycena rebaudengoi]